jgi:hypothetical protein
VSSAAPSRSEPTHGGSAPAARGSATGRAARVLAVMAAAGALLLSGLPLCPVAYLGGVPCPGCGLTRAGLCLLRGDLRAAVELSPLSPIVVPFVGVVVARAFWLYLRGRAELPPRWVTRGALGLWALLIVVWGLRFLGWFGGPVGVNTVWR